MGALLRIRMNRKSVVGAMNVYLYYIQGPPDERGGENDEPDSIAFHCVALCLTGFVVQITLQLIRFFVE